MLLERATDWDWRRWAKHLRFHNLSLQWKIWLSTSVALTLLFAVTGYILQRHTMLTTSGSLEEEVKASFQAYDSAWRARADSLLSVSGIMSSMPGLRTAAGTRDQLAVREAAGELWLKVSDNLRETAFFQVTDPSGGVIASLDNSSQSALPFQWPLVATLSRQFPRQVAGFLTHKGNLFQLVLTPVYVDSPRGPVLVNVLVAGYNVNHIVAQRLKDSAGGSEFLFLSQGRVFASTLNDRATVQLASNLTLTGHTGLISDGVSEYASLTRDLIDLNGQPIGVLGIFRSFEGARQRVYELRRDIVLIWLCAVLIGLALTWALARKIVEPVEKLDRAAAEIARQNYDYRVPAMGSDELGRLALTFNTMCGSIQSARQELIRQERISTIGRMASSIVHDLRNPLAAIYGGAEMMVDTELSAQQAKRLAGNIYKASRRIQEMLQDLVNVSRGRAEKTELARLRDVVAAAADSLRPTADSQLVAIVLQVPEEIELPMEAARVERVFVNLISNAIEAMPEGGEIHIRGRLEDSSVLVEVEDTGPGISREVRGQLFQPFVSFGKKNGLGLGLALSRQTVLDHGGEMWAASEEGRGACFRLRLPMARIESSAAAVTAVSSNRR